MGNSSKSSALLPLVSSHLPTSSDNFTPNSHLPKRTISESFGNLKKQRCFIFSMCCTTERYLCTEKVVEISPVRFLVQGLVQGYIQGHCSFAQIRQSSPLSWHMRHLVQRRSWVRISTPPTPGPSLWSGNQPTYHS